MWTTPVDCVWRNEMAQLEASTDEIAPRLDVLSDWRAAQAEHYELAMEVPFGYPPATDLAWAAGLFAGEGSCIVIRRKTRTYMFLSIQMLDERSVQRFASIFDKRVETYPLYYDKSRRTYRVSGAGRTAEAILRVMWPYLEGTDKGDQVERVARECGVFAWIDGTAVEPRSRRDGGNQWTGRRHSTATKKKMSESQRATRARKRLQGE
jgi:hypothetical protein